MKLIHTYRKLSPKYQFQKRKIKVCNKDCTTVIKKRVMFELSFYSFVKTIIQNFLNISKKD